MIKRAKLPGLIAPRFEDPALQRWAIAVTERLEVREGARGDSGEQVVRKKDLSSSISAVSTDTPIAPKPAVVSSGSSSTFTLETLKQELRQELLRKMVSELALRDARITRAELKIQEVSRALDATKSELIALINSIRSSGS